MGVDAFSALHCPDVDRLFHLFCPVLLLLPMLPPQLSRCLNQIFSADAEDGEGLFLLAALARGRNG